MTFQEQVEKSEKANKHAMDLISMLTPFELRQVFYQAQKELRQAYHPCPLFDNVAQILQAFQDGDS